MRVLRLDEPSRAAWLVTVADAAIFVSLVLLLGRWDIAGYYTRFLLIGLFLLAILWSWRHHRSRPWRVPGSPVWRQHWTTLVSVSAFGAALVYILAGLMPPAEPKELVFPLKGGHFMVGQGGGVTLLNHHAGHPQQRHAADITAINEFGIRATGLLPEDLDDYEIYGSSVVSPCDGTVRGVQDGLPDLAPPRSDAENPRGNHIIVSCDGISVELAHLQNGSVAVEAGETVGAGEEVARVGNSGNTTEPHLHVHAVDPETRAGVPISFGGRSPFRNRVFSY